MKVVKNYFYNMSYQIFVLIVPLITIPYISRVLGPSGVGINTLTSSTIQYFVLFANLGLTTYGQRQIAYERENKQKMSQTFWEIEIVSVVTTVISLILFLVLMFFVDKLRIYYFAQSILIIASAADISWLFMGLEKFKITVFRNFLIKILSVILIFSLVKVRENLLIYILIISGTTLLGNLSLWPYLKKYLVKVNIHEFSLLQHLRPTITLFIPQIAINLYTILNKIILGHLSTVESAGFFDNSDKIVRLLLTIVTAFTTVMMPHVARAYVEGKRESVLKMLNGGMSFAIIIMAPLVAIVNGVVKQFVPWFFGSNFSPVIQVLQVESFAMIPIACAGIIGAQYLVPLNMNKKYSYSIFCGAIVNVIISIPLISNFNAVGAALAMVIAEFFVTAVQFHFVIKEIKINRLLETAIKVAIGSVLTYVLVCMEANLLPASFISMAIEGTSGIILYLLILVILRLEDLTKLIKVLQDKLFQ